MVMNVRQAAAIEAIRTPVIAARYMSAYDKLLQKWPVPFESTIIPTRFGATHVIVSGPAGAPPLVLLHGLQATALVWRPNVEMLSRYFRVYAFDVIGQGGRSSSSQRLHKRQQLVDWMCELFEAFGIKQADLVGNSYGGFVALNLASLAPERVKRVVLINPGGVFVSIIPFLLKMVWSLITATLRFCAKPPKPTMSQMLGRNVRLTGVDAEWEALLSLVTFNWEVKVNGVYPVKFSDTELRSIEKPVLLLMSDNDLVYDPLATLAIAQKRMPSLQAHMVSGAHHAAAMAKPETVNEMILKFLL
jgi:pimeloyl-ACP methyl ester carboxylesterase